MRIISYVPGLHFMGVAIHEFLDLCLKAQSAHRSMFVV